MNGSLFIDGRWCGGGGGETVEARDPATGEVTRVLDCATISDLDDAIEASERGFRKWRAMPAFERCMILLAAAQLVRERAERIASFITLEQGKPIAEARIEALGAADIITWYAEEARRVYGRTIPSRRASVMQIVQPEPVGPVAAFSPWNFPVGQAVRKIAAALAAGCSIVIKPPEETPSACAELCRAFEDAGLPGGVLNMVFGIPERISQRLIPAPQIRKISFTGSVAVGRKLSELAGRHLKRTTMELGGHAPFIVFEDANVDAVAALAVQMKFRNAGQICTSPSRFLVHESVFTPMLERFAKAAGSLQVARGDVAGVQMGPLAHSRRVLAMEEFVAEAQAGGAKVVAGGGRIGPRGNFFHPTVLAGLAPDARVLREEPFGPIAPFVPFRDFDEAIAMANALSYGLAAYAFTRSLRTAAQVAEVLECGMVSINHFGFALPEVPFGGIKDSGHGSEGGREGLEEYLVPKFISQSAA